MAQDALILYCAQPLPPRNSSAWLYVVTRRLCHRRVMRELARLNAEQAYVLHEQHASAGIDLLMDLHTILHRLTPRERRLILRVVEGASSKEIAVEFKCNVQDVGQMVARVRRKTRTLFSRKKK